MGLFKTLLLLGIMHKWIPGGQLSGPLEVIGANWFFYMVCALAAVEILVDFVARWDIHWDRWNAWLRIGGAVALSWFVLYQEDAFSRVMMATVGFALALTSYTAKTAARRAAIRGRTAFIVAPIASITETCMICATLLPLTKLPPLTLLMVAFMTMAAMLIIYMVRQEARDALSWVFTGRWVEPVAEEPHSSEIV